MPSAPPLNRVDEMAALAEADRLFRVDLQRTQRLRETQAIVGRRPPRRSRTLTVVYAGCLVFRPGAGGGPQPDMQHNTASIRLPCSKRVRLHVMMAPVADNSARPWRTLAHRNARFLWQDPSRVAGRIA